MKPITDCVKEIEKRGLDDWIQAAEVASVAKCVGHLSDDSTIQDLALAAVTELLSRGLMKAGDVTTEGFRDWQVSPSEAIHRIEKSWKALGRLPTLGEIFWLSNTQEGDRFAREG